MGKERFGETFQQKCKRCKNVKGSSVHALATSRLKEMVCKHRLSPVMFLKVLDFALKGPLKSVKIYLKSISQHKRMTFLNSG